MGEIAEMIMDGILCEECGSLVDGEAPGYPRTCDDCQAENAKPKKRSNKKSK